MNMAVENLSRPAKQVNMLTRLDHFVLICPDIDRGTATYQTLLGSPPDWQVINGSAAQTVFTVNNTAIELVAPLNGGPIANRLSKLLDGQSGRLTSLVFASDDISADHHAFTRRGLTPDDIKPNRSQNAQTGKIRRWEKFRCADAACAGIKTFILQAETELPVRDKEPDQVLSLDHLVINTPNPDRAIAHYGARLGLPFALDRTIDTFNTRFLFFRTGELTLEIIHRLDQPSEPDDKDTIWGLTWKVKDLKSAHNRLNKAGLNISDIRTGRKPGTEVFSVRDGTLGVPTLFLSET